MQNGSALNESFRFNCGQQILSPLFSVLGSPGHETIDPARHGTMEFRVTRVVRTTSHSAARRTSTWYRPRPLAKQELIPTGSFSVTVPALRQGSVLTQKNLGCLPCRPSNFSHSGPKFFCVFTQYTDVRTR